MQFYSDLLTAVWNIQHLGQTYVLWARLVWYWPVDDTSLLWTRPVFSRPNRSGPDQTVLKPDPKPDGVWSRVHRCDQRGLVWLRCFIFQAKLESEREMFFTKLCFLVVFSFQMNPKQFKQTWWNSDEPCEIQMKPVRFQRTPWDSDEPHEISNEPREIQAKPVRFGLKSHYV